MRCSRVHRSAGAQSAFGQPTPPRRRFGRFGRRILWLGRVKLYGRGAILLGRSVGLSADQRLASLLRYRRQHLRVPAGGGAAATRECGGVRREAKGRGGLTPHSRNGLPARPTTTVKPRAACARQGAGAGAAAAAAPHVQQADWSARRARQLHAPRAHAVVRQK
eukprot:scaffold7166_cov140-Isochrysis_galbana.AAC.3